MQATAATTAAPYAIHRYPTEWIGSWPLRDGALGTVRPVLPQDDVAEQAFVEALSASTRRKRFHAAVSGLSEGLAQAMTRIDYRRQMALVVTVMEGEQERVIADARYAIGADGECAEFAIVVADAWRGQGLATRLLGLLGRCAQRAGARWMVGEVLRDNREMLALAEHCGFSIADGSIEGDDATVRVERSVAAMVAASSGPAARASAFDQFMLWVMPAAGAVH